jgi:TRAP-type C4-dicarboxylate transport system substrate-binding protein
LSIIAETKSLLVGAVLATTFGATATRAQTTLRGASMFDENHAFAKTMVRFTELVAECYDGELGATDLLAATRGM